MTNPTMRNFYVETLIGQATGSSRFILSRPLPSSLAKTTPFKPFCAAFPLSRRVGTCLKRNSFVHLRVSAWRRPKAPTTSTSAKHCCSWLRNGRLPPPGWTMKMASIGHSRGQSTRPNGRYEGPAARHRHRRIAVRAATVLPSKFPHGSVLSHE